MDDRAHRSHALGQRGEDAAARFLVSRGFQILGRNVRLPTAEIDLVARDNEGLAFVEVKARSTTTFGHPYESVTDAKRRRCESAALQFIEDQRLGEVDFRFGIISVVMGADGQVLSLEWIDEAS